MDTNKKKEKSDKSKKISIKVDGPFLKAAFEILNGINQEQCYFKCTALGFTITSVTNTSQQKKSKKQQGNTKGRCQAHYTFESKKIPRYRYGLITKDMKPIEYCDFLVKTSDFYQHIKALKKPTISFKILVNINEPSYSLQFTTSSGGYSFLSTQLAPKRITYVDQFDYWYSDVKQVANLESQSLHSFIYGAKQTKCTEVQFCLNKRTRNMTLKTWEKDVLVSSDPMENVESISSYEDDDEDDHYIIRTVDIGIDDWVGSINKLSTRSVILIYMKDDDKAPLIITSHIGTQGYAVFSIPNTV
jgi:hypothetical protein